MSDVTPTPKPGESVEARRIAEAIANGAMPSPATVRQVAEAYLALLTQQSQDRAELEGWKEKGLDAFQAMVSVGDKNRKLQAELDRAVEREKALIRGYRILAAKHPDDSDYEANIIAGFSHAETPLAASPGKGAEGEAGNG